MSRKTSKTHKTVSEQLRSHVLASGVSGYRLERETGIHNSTLSRFLRGERGLSMEALDALCNHFGLRLTGPKKRSARCKCSDRTGIPPRAGIMRCWA